MADDDQDDRELSPALSLAELQRIAFGRADSAAERERADRALRQLQRLEARAIRDASEHAPTTDADGAADDTGGHGGADGAVRNDAERDIGRYANNDGTGESGADADDVRAESVLNRPISALPRWLLPSIALGLVAVGVIAGVVAGGTAGAIPSALPSGHSSEVGINSGEGQAAFVDAAGTPPPLNVGDITAAGRWFESAQTPEDALPMPLDMIDPTTSRLVFQAPGDNAWSAWVGRNSLEEGFCIVISHPDSGLAESTCMTTASFIMSGLSIATSTGVSLNWNGSEVTAIRSR